MNVASALLRTRACRRTGERVANPGSTARLVPRSAVAPAARASSARLLRGDFSRRDRSRTQSSEQLQRLALELKAS